MKLKIVLLLIISFFIFYWNVSAVHYTLWYNSVTNWEVKYNWTSKYDNLIINATNTWNNYWDINLYQYYWTQQLDVNIYDVSESKVEWWGIYDKKYWIPSTIRLNKWIFDWYSSLWFFSDTKKQKTITHEFWHVLWLEHHGITWNVMKSWVSTQTSLWTQDKYDYDSIW